MSLKKCFIFRFKSFESRNDTHLLIEMYRMFKSSTVRSRRVQHDMFFLITVKMKVE